jgi:superfamily II DNA or RNA helicase
LIDDFLFKRIQIKGQEEKGSFFVVDIIHGILKTNALLYPIDLPDKQLIKIPLSELHPTESSSISAKDVFSSLLIKSLSKTDHLLSSSLFFYNVIYKPYQFRPLLKYIENSRNRILIADETGLGKTIEAAYIIINEIYQSQSKRILIVCPASLREKWKHELWNRFGLPFDIVSSYELFSRIMNDDFEFYYIVSQDSGRKKELSDILNCLPENMIDLLIIDEIHNLIGRSGETIRRTFGQNLSLISKGVVGLSATPIQIDLMDFNRIFDIVDPEMISQSNFNSFMETNNLLIKFSTLLEKKSLTLDDKKTLVYYLNRYEESMLDFGIKITLIMDYIKNKLNVDEISLLEKHNLTKKLYDTSPITKYYTRTKRIDVGEYIKRIIINKTIQLDDTIESYYQGDKLVTASEIEVYREIDDILTSSFNYVHRRQLSSSLPAIVDLMRSGIRGMNVWVRGENEHVDIKLTDFERKRCLEAANKYDILSSDSKWDELIKIIDELRESKKVNKILVFTQWIPTINYFKSKRNDFDFPTYAVSGIENTYQRQAIIKSFKDEKDFSILFSSDVMSEGLDLQFANCVINYDLPYNPSKLEQRIGRVDRVGQKSELIYVVNLMIAESDDEIIFNRLYDRINIFENYIGSLPDVIEEKQNIRTIDDHQVTHIIEQKEISKKLMQNNIPILREDYYDDKIDDMKNSYSQSIYDIRLLVIQQLLSIVLGKRHQSISERHVIYEGIGDNEINVLSNIVDLKYKNMIKNDLVNCMSENGLIKFTLDYVDDGLNIQYGNPLISSTLNIINKHYKKTCENIICLTIKPKKNKFDLKCIFLSLYEYEGVSFNDSEYIWWGLSKKDALIRLSSDVLSKLTETNEIRYDKKGVGKQYEQRIVAEISPEYNKWLDSVQHFDSIKSKQKDINQKRLFNKRISNLLFQLKTSDLIKQKEIEDEITKIEIELAPINNRLTQRKYDNFLTVSNLHSSVSIISVITVN